jgi:outer membrane protein assembly factor BamB
MLLGDTLVVGSFDRRLYGINVKDGTQRWEFQAKNWFWAGAVTDGKTIFASSMDGNVYALDGDGNLRWTHALGSPVVATPALVSRGLVVATRNGKVSVLDTSPADLGAARELSSRFIRGAVITAPLAASGDSVYLGAQDGTVRRIQIRDTQIQVWCFSTQTKDGSTQCE